MLLLCILNPAYAQVPPAGRLSGPTVFPPSPTAASLGRYGELPVNQTNGIPQINIPIYELVDGDIKIPLSLDYYGAPIKVIDKAGWVGTNWSLNAGGVITRFVKGLPDEDARGLFWTYEGLQNPAPKTYLQPTTTEQNDRYLRVFSENWDTEPDIFYYNFLGHQGKFYFDQNKAIHIVPYDDIKIETPVNNMFDEFTVTTNDGVKYYFGGPSAKERQTAYDEMNPSFYDLYSCFNAWYLKSITMPSGQTATFTYNSDPTIITTKNLSENSDFLRLRQPQDPKWNPDIFNKISDFNTMTYTKVLQSIETDNAKIFFATKNTEREDLPEDFALDEIRVFSKMRNETIKQFKFTQSYYLSPYSNCPLKYGGLAAPLYERKRMLLDAVVEIKPNSTVIARQYQFEYDSGELPPACSCAQDHYGNYNGAISNVNMLPQVTVMDPSAPYANRNPNPATIANHLLKKIIYPTGGYSLLNFQSPSASDIIGSTRIESIADYDLSGALISKKTYQYADPIVQWSAANEDYSRHLWVVRAEEIFPMSGLPYTIFHDSEYQKRSSNVYYNNGNYEGPRVSYATVTVLDGDNGQNGKSVFNYPFVYDDQHNGFPFAPATSFGWRRGLLLKKTDYDALGSKKLEITNNYSFKAKDTTRVFKIFVDKFYPRSAGITPENFCYQNPMTYRYYELISDRVQLDSTTTLSYDSGSELKPISIKEKYFYQSPNNTALTKKEINRSEGNSDLEFYTYPTDYTGGTQWLTDMNNNFFKSIPIEIVKARKEQNGNINITSGVITTYKAGGSGLKDAEYAIASTAPLTLSSYKFSNQSSGVLPHSGSRTSFVQDSRYEKRFEYSWSDKTSSSKARLLEYRKDLNPTVSIFWNQNQTYPVAEIKNALSKDVFYESFEDGNGNSEADDCQTGRYSKTGSYSKALTGLTNGNYVLRYWLKSSGKWMLSQQQQIVTAGSYSIALFGQLDDICFYPLDAQMTTYTYNPLVGMTSMTDPKGQTIYYEYDNLQRLHLIKDSKRKIVKEICYNYAGQAGGCPLIIGTPGSGSQVIYARIETTNISSTPQYSTEGSFVSDRADVTIAFYSDAACQLPLVLNSALDVVVHTETIQDRNYSGQYVYPSNNTYHVSAGSRKYFLGNMLIESTNTYQDPQYGTVTDTETTTFTVTANGTLYTPKPSI